MLNSAGPNRYSHTYVAGASFQVRSEQVSRQGGFTGLGARHFSNPIINNGSEVENLRLRQSGAALYSSTNQQLMHHLVNAAGRLMYGTWRAELGAWIGLLLAFV